MVGAKNVPPNAWRLPPHSRRASCTKKRLAKNAGLARVAELRGERTVDGGIDVGRTLERCCAMTLRQLFQAMSASSIARRVSAAPNCGTLPSLAPVAGSKTSSVRPSSASSHNTVQIVIFR
jgi:hypothetical protein